MGSCLSWVICIFVVVCGTLSFISWAITKGGFLTFVSIILIISAIVGVYQCVKNR